MSSLILISIALTALLLALAGLVFVRQKETLKQLRLQRQLLARLDSVFDELLASQGYMTKRIDQLAKDVLQREIYQNADDRHQLAIQSAKQGKGFFELMQCHGLSSDEAALIISLHSPRNNKEEPLVKNANLVDPTALDIV
ncbi:MAG: hypothetical protein AB8B97_03285 [Granulosicoccus sp.]